jgi:tRNA dimethylallyltransferase
MGKPNDFALIVAGPTCSGKSALALDIARRMRGTIINADSMQVYRELRVLTARPSAAEEAEVPHALYGVRDAASAGSVAWWRAAALDAMARARDAGRLPILCGGTGLYLMSLARGLADIPEPGDEARSEARELLATLGAPALHARLAECDPVTASRLRPSDAQRVARAWEVLRGTGAGLASWQEHPGAGAPWRFACMMLDPPREALRAAIPARFAAMIEGGAIEEVRALLAARLDPALPAMRAHGVPELSAYLRGEITLTDAAARAVRATAQYTKRQATWFRHRPVCAAIDTHTIHARYAGYAQFPESESAEIFAFVEARG